jgi:uncharacterized protein YbjT (DUF2867 family)
MILVVGSTGMVGSEICRRLAARHRPIRALVRTTSQPLKIEALRALGVEIAIGDLRDAASLASACQGVSTVISTAASMPLAYEAGVNDVTSTDVAGVRQLVDAARTAGVARFIYTSISGNIKVSCPLHDAKREIERYLQGSGLTWTILRPSCFMQVWLTPAVGFDPANARVTVYGDGDRPISWISIEDLAEIAVRSLDVPVTRNAILELGGPEPLTPLEAIRIFERLAGRTFEVRHVSEEALRAQQEAAADPMQQSFAALMRAVARGDSVDMHGLLQSFGMRLTSVEEFAAVSLGKMPTHA